MSAPRITPGERRRLWSRYFRREAPAAADAPPADLTPGERAYCERTGTDAAGFAEAKRRMRDRDDLAAEVAALTDDERARCASTRTDPEAFVRTRRAAREAGVALSDAELAYCAKTQTDPRYFAGARNVVGSRER